MELTFPYYIFLGLVLFIFAQYNDSKPKDNIIPVALTLILMILFAGLRNQSVGTDTMAYVKTFAKSHTAQLDGDIYEMLKSEPGYFILQKISGMFSTNYGILLCTIATICYSLVIKTILKLSDNKVLSLFIYITLGYYTFCFNAARQALALSIYLLAIPCIMNRHFMKYAIIVCIAALFHKSVLIALPLYVIFKLEFSWKSVIIVVIAGLITSTYLPMVLESAQEIDNRYKIYADAKAVGGYMLTAFYVLLSAFCIFMRNRVGREDRPQYDVFLQMLICGSVIYLVVSLTRSYVELTRFAAYFQISTIFLIATLYKSTDNKKWTSILPIFVCGCLAFFYIFLTTMAALVPYKFNTTL